MKSPKLLLTLSAPMLLLALSTQTQAHEPKEHMQDAQMPGCTAMKEMDHAKMDMKDPVMQAMMQQCMKKMSHDNKADVGNAHTGHEHHAEKDEKQSSSDMQLDHYKH